MDAVTNSNFVKLLSTNVDRDRHDLGLSTFPRQRILTYDDVETFHTEGNDSLTPNDVSQGRPSEERGLNGGEMPRKKRSLTDSELRPKKSKPPPWKPKLPPKKSANSRTECVPNPRESDVDAVTNSNFVKLLSANADRDRHDLGLSTFPRQRILTYDDVETFHTEGNDSLTPNDVSQGRPSEERGLNGGDAKQLYQPLDANAVVREVYEARQPHTQELYQPLGPTTPIEDYELPANNTQEKQQLKFNVNKSPSNLGGSAPSDSKQTQSSPLSQRDPESVVQLPVTHGTASNFQPKMCTMDRCKSLRIVDYCFLVLLIIAILVGALAFVLSISAQTQISDLCKRSVNLC